MAGLGSGLTEAVVVNPFEVVKVRLQANRDGFKEVRNTQQALIPPADHRITALFEGGSPVVPTYVNSTAALNPRANLGPTGPNARSDTSFQYGLNHRLSV